MSWKQRVIDWQTTLSVPKAITVLCLLGLGVNGLLQVGIQRDIEQKALQLKGQVAQTHELSGEMKAGLQGLSELQTASARMEAKLGRVQAETAGMNEELAELDGSVRGIGEAVQKLGSSTGATAETLKTAHEAASELLAVLRGIEGTNSGMVTDLAVMLRAQEEINRNLREMNDKTLILPQWRSGGGNP
ncbi:hypothetical protein CBW65_21670 [Tumebacillus avium]|uniref:Uncharacterized protein n=1 Tax=Tumebacillus avium TaxID=1903704 RepID=A0A1Y0ISP8_9BACL|nr:hypothetical protein [Tumebacillus avium]ARU63300.1 hypothetical protein CBW65_21670 [Tumebacillus avium]